MGGEREREEEEWRSTGIEVSGLNFSYDGQPPLSLRSSTSASRVPRAASSSARTDLVGSPLFHLSQYKFEQY
jgi:hypothetical protein